MELLFLCDLKTKEEEKKRKICWLNEWIWLHEWKRNYYNEGRFIILSRKTTKKKQSVKRNKEKS